MERVPTRDKYPKAVIEEPNLRLPKAMLKPDGDPNDDLCYVHLFEDDGRKAQHLAEAVAAGATPSRKVYRIRNKELAKALKKDFEGMRAIQKASKATIGILADTETNRHNHSYLDLMGTTEQVDTAEGLILDSILKSYSTLAYPVILMPPTIYVDYIIIPRHKVSRVIGTTHVHLTRMEMVSGAWIKIEPGTPPGRSDKEILINVFGPRKNVMTGINSIRAVTYEPSEPSAAQEELLREFNEPHWRDFFERNKDEEEAKLEELSGEPEKEKPAEEGGSSQPEKEKQADEGGSSQPEKEKQAEENVKEADPKEAEKNKSKKRNKKRGGKGAKQTKESMAKELSGESEKGQQKAEEGGSGVTEKEKQPEHVLEKNEDEKEKSQEEDVANKK